MLQPRSTPDRVRAALATTDDVRLILASDEFDTWAVGNDRIAKFARADVHAEKVPLEIGIHSLVRGRLGDLVPRILDHGEADGVPFAVFERAFGRQGQTMEGDVVEPGEGLAADLGRILATLHTIGAAEALAAGARDRPLHFAPLHLADATIERVGALVGHDRLRTFLDAEPPSPVDREVFCHTDVKGEHLFLDECGSRVRHVIDWADAEVCDPAKDYADLTIWRGPSFTRAVVAAGGEDDGSMAERAIWLGRAGNLDYWDNVLAGTETAPTQLLIAQVRAAFSD